MMNRHATMLSDRAFEPYPPNGGRLAARPIIARVALLFRGARRRSKDSSQALGTYPLIRAGHAVTASFFCPKIAESSKPCVLHGTRPNALGIPGVSHSNTGAQNYTSLRSLRTSTLVSRTLRSAHVDCRT